MGFDSKVSRLQNAALSDSFFGTEIIYRPRAGGFFHLKGIFFNDFSEKNSSMDAEIFSQQLNVDLKLSDLSFTPKEDDTVEIKNQIYRVNSIKYDGLGMATLFLYQNENKN